LRAEIFPPIFFIFFLPTTTLFSAKRQTTAFFFLFLAPVFSRGSFSGNSSTVNNPAVAPMPLEMEATVSLSLSLSLSLSFLQRVGSGGKRSLFESAIEMRKLNAAASKHPRVHPATAPGLPDGLFSSQKSQFG
jgi:hypothetical protein